MNPVFVAAFVLAGSLEPRFTQIPLDPFPARATTVEYAGGNLWVGTTLGEVWRFGSSGAGDKFQLPVAEPVQRILAKGGMVRVLAGGSVWDPESHSTSPLAELAGADQAVPVREGWVVITRGGRLLYLRGNDEPRRLTLTKSRRPDDAAAGAANAPETSLASSGILLAQDEDHVLYVQNAPYASWTLGLDGSVRHVAIDESDVSERLGREPESGRPWATRTTRAYFKGGHLLVDRSLRTYEPGVDGPAISRTRSFLDHIDLETGKVLRRVDLTALNPWGLFAGLRGDDTAAFFVQIGPDGPAYLSFAPIPK